MKKLIEILKGIKILSSYGDLDKSINGITDNSNFVNKNFKHIYLLIIEFHDIHKNMSKIKKFLKKSKLKLIHIHGNNYAGKNKNKDTNVLEFTMLKSKKFKIIKNRSSFKYPVYGLDYKNFTRQSDIDLKFDD